MRLNDGWRAVLELFGMLAAQVAAIVIWLWALFNHPGWFLVANLIAAVWLAKRVYDNAKAGRNWWTWR